MCFQRENHHVLDTQYQILYTSCIWWACCLCSLRFQSRGHMLHTDWKRWSSLFHAQHQGSQSQVKPDTIKHFPEIDVQQCWVALLTWMKKDCLQHLRQSRTLYHPYWNHHGHRRRHSGRNLPGQSWHHPDRNHSVHCHLPSRQWSHIGHTSFCAFHQTKSTCSDGQ